MNGTTNFMLSKMEAEGANYEDVLKEAQDLGYAEGRLWKAILPCFDLCCLLLSLVREVTSGRCTEGRSLVRMSKGPCCRHVLKTPACFSSRRRQ